MRKSDMLTDDKFNFNYNDFVKIRHFLALSIIKSIILLNQSNPNLFMKYLLNVETIKLSSLLQNNCLCNQYYYFWHTYSE